MPGCPRQSRLTYDQQRMVMSFWALVRSPLITGGDLTLYTEEDLAMLTNRDILHMQVCAQAVHKQRGESEARVAGKTGPLRWLLIVALTFDIRL